MNNELSIIIENNLLTQILFLNVMKKSLILFSVAALALVSCAKVQDVYTPEAHEIAFQAITTPATRAAVDGTTFPNVDMQVAAWDVTNSRDFFTATAFTKSETTWKGGKYWPLSATYINFLAYANLTAGSATWDLAGADKAASGVTLVMADNKTTQNDLMYAIGNGEVTQTGNNLAFPANVPMNFKHAQAWITFTANAYDAASGGKVTLNSITLNGAKYNGTFTVTHTNYNASSSQSVAGAWTALGDAQNVAVPSWTPAAIAFGDAVSVGAGLMIVPDDNAATADFTSFTLNYTLDGKTYDYTYIPATAAAANVDQAKHYIYNIVFHLHEIEIAPTVTDWADQSATPVPIF